MNKQYFLDRAYFNNSSIFEKYSYDLVPDSFLAHDLLLITCFKHGDFQQKAYSHMSGKGCHKCYYEIIGKSSRLSNQEFIDKSKKRFKDKFDYSKTNYTNKEGVVTLSCNVHGEISLRATQHMWCKHGCPKCDYEIPKIISKNKNIEKANIIHGNKYDYSKVSFKNMDSKVEIICPIHGSFFQNLSSHVLRGCSCPKCSIDDGKVSIDDFIKRAIKVHGDKYDYKLVIYKTGHDKVFIICKEHGVFQQRASSHLLGNGCKKCFLVNNRSNKEEFINKAKELHGKVYDYSRVAYRTNKVPVELICKKHGSFMIRPDQHLWVKVGCPRCSESKGEAEIALFLERCNIKFLREYKVAGYRYRYDFYIPDANILIEFHGQQHYRPVKFFGGEDAFKLCKYRDSEKVRIAKDLKYKLLVFNYRDRDLKILEKIVTRELKIIYNYWLVLNGKLHLFKRLSNLIKTFELDKKLSEDEVLAIIKNKYTSYVKVF